MLSMQLLSRNNSFTLQMSRLSLKKVHVSSPSKICQQVVNTVHKDSALLISLLFCIIAFVLFCSNNSDSTGIKRKTLQETPGNGANCK